MDIQERKVIEEGPIIELSQNSQYNRPKRGEAIVVLCQIIDLLRS